MARTPKKQRKQPVTHTAVYADIGKRIRQVRLAANITQEKLAKELSLTRASVANIEKGRQKILLHTLFDLARALRVPTTTLIPEVEPRTMEEKLPQDLSEKDREFVLSIAQRNR